MTNYTAAVLFEHRFWLQVLGDHARFIKDALSPDERDEIQSAEYFINKVLSTLTPLMPDHMLREECYYLIKLAQSSEVRMPDCDPTRPRVES